MESKENSKTSLLEIVNQHDADNVEPLTRPNAHPKQTNVLSSTAFSDTLSTSAGVDVQHTLSDLEMGRLAESIRSRCRSPFQFVNTSRSETEFSSVTAEFFPHRTHMSKCYYHRLPRFPPYNARQWQNPWYILWFALLNLACCASIMFPSDYLQNPGNVDGSMVRKYVALHSILAGIALFSSGVFLAVVFLIPQIAFGILFALLITIYVGMGGLFVWFMVRDGIDAAFGWRLTAAVLSAIMIAIHVSVYFRTFRRGHIKFSIAMIQHVSRTVSRNKKVVLPILIGMTACLGVLFLYGFMLATVILQASITFSSWALSLLVVVVLLSFYWVVQTIRHILHFIVAYAFAVDQLVPADMRPKDIVTTAARIALSKSLGSIIRASVLMPVFRPLRFITTLILGITPYPTGVLKHYYVDVIRPLLSINLLAMTEMGIYGQSYSESCTNFWRLCKRIGIQDFLSSYILLHEVCRLAPLAVGFMVATLYYWYAPTDMFYNEISTFVVASITVMLAVELVQASTCSTMVCLALDPIAMKRNRPRIYEQYCIEFANISEQVRRSKQGHRKNGRDV